MSAGGWIFMLASWSFIIVLTFWCIFKVFRSTKKGD